MVWFFALANWYEPGSCLATWSYLVLEASSLANSFENSFVHASFRRSWTSTSKTSSLSSPEDSFDSLTDASAESIQICLFPNSSSKSQQGLKMRLKCLAIAWGLKSIILNFHHLPYPWRCYFLISLKFKSHSWTSPTVFPSWSFACSSWDPPSLFPVL